MEQQRAINALEPFLALSKSATSPRAAADLIKQATSVPNTFVFAELLHTPNIHALQNTPDHASHHKLLEIFAWGTWADYQCNRPRANVSYIRNTKTSKQRQPSQNSQTSSKKSSVCSLFSH